MARQPEEVSKYEDEFSVNQPDKVSLIIIENR